jgi:N-glycosylase/DNA lyase
MQKLVKSIKSLKTTKISTLVEERMALFRALGRSGEEGIFKELCFCILTANYSAEGGIRIQKEIGSGFLTLSESGLSSELKRLGYRFPNMRARYIVDARSKRKALAKAISSLEGRALRCWLAENIYGLGYKEASHFLRNIGYREFAIIDFHIIDILAANGVIEKPSKKSLAKKRYEEIEEVLAILAEKSGTSQGELDLYLWYMETGKILK